MWQEQYERSLRSMRRVKAHCEGRAGFPHFGPDQVAEFRDDVIHAFQDLFHVRDWLKKDPAVTVADATIKQLFQDNQAANPYLHLVRDLANGSKHLENTRPSVGTDVAVAKTSHVVVNLGGEMRNSHISQSISIELGGGKTVDALHALEAAHKELENFLKLNRLL